MVKPRFRYAAALAVVVAAVMPSGANAQAPAPQAPQFAPSEVLPFDPAATRGTLPNGLTYYIRRNTQPDDRVVLQLAVKAGSVDETEAQQGLAHFLEHMAFNGSRNFKPGELIATLESTGARMGPHVNAYTSFDETVYQFELPTDKPEIVRKGLQALADVAGGLTLDPKEVEKERGVVIEEWRGGLGASARLRDQQIPVLFHGSKYADRLPIGKPDVLKSFTPATLREFYNRWYRPDRMALVVVGDIDPSQVESTIRSMFAPLENPKTAAPERSYPVPIHDELLMKVATDPEATQSAVTIMRKRQDPPEGTVADYRRELVEQAVSQMMNERFDELGRRKDAPFLGAGAFESPLSPTTTTFALSARAEEGKLPQALAALEIEANRVQRHGFGASELDRAKKWWLASYERAFNERDKTNSASYADEYVRHFLTGEPAPGIAYEYRLAQALIPTITAAEVADAARGLFTDAGRVVVATAPQKPGVPVPTEAELRQAMDSAESVAVAPWNDAVTARALVENPPDPGAIKSRRDIAPLGVTVVTFDNGVEAWFKPTDFKNDEVLFSLSAPGGASLAEPDKYLEAVLAPALVQLSGAGGHTAVDLQKMLAGKIARASAGISLSTHGISGAARPADLESALQLLYLNVTAPGNDETAFGNIRRQLEALYANRDQNPELLFGEKISAVNTGGHYTAEPVTPARLARLDRAAMASFYRDRFSNAADFSFFMVGAFEVDDVLPLVAQYVGGLPSTGKAVSRPKDVGLRFPASIQREVVQKGREPKVSTQLSFFADPPQDPAEVTRVVMAADVLEIALRDILREELGETYTVGVGFSQQTLQRGGGHIGISFTGAPDRAEKMAARVLEEVARMQKQGPSADLTMRAKETARREHEVGMKQNGYWLSRLQTAELLELDPVAHMLQREARIDAVTPAALQEAFQKYFPLDRYTVVTLVPEK